MRALTVYTHRTNPERGALAAEITPADLSDGRGGVVGDFYVVEPGGRPQWTERATFHAQWEKLASPTSEKVADLGPFIDEARAAIHALAPVPAPAADSSSSSDESTPEDLEREREYLHAALHELRSRFDDYEALAARNLEAQNARIEQLETAALEERTKFAAQLEQLEPRVTELYGKLDDLGNGTTELLNGLTERVGYLEESFTKVLETAPAAAAEPDAGKAPAHKKGKRS